MRITGNTNSSRPGNGGPHGEVQAHFDKLFSGREGQTLRDVPSRHAWPIGMLKFLTRFPHAYQIWLNRGHTMPNGPACTPFDDSVGFGGVALSW